MLLCLKVPELAGFWLLSILLQFPLILFQLFNEAILIQPLERGVHIVLAAFLLIQVSLHSSLKPGIGSFTFSTRQLHIHHLGGQNFEIIFPVFPIFSFIYSVFVITQALSGFVALREMVRHTESQFHLRQFD